MDKKVYYWLAAAGWAVAVFMALFLIESLTESTSAKPSIVVIMTLMVVFIGAFGAASGTVFMRLYRQKVEEERHASRTQQIQPQPPIIRRF